MIVVRLFCRIIHGGMETNCAHDSHHSTKLYMKVWFNSLNWNVNLLRCAIKRTSTGITTYMQSNNNNLVVIWRILKCHWVECMRRMQKTAENCAISEARVAGSAFPILYMWMEISDHDMPMMTLELWLR